MIIVADRFMATPESIRAGKPAVAAWLEPNWRAVCSALELFRGCLIALPLDDLTLSNSEPNFCRESSYPGLTAGAAFGWDTAGSHRWAWRLGFPAEGADHGGYVGVSPCLPLILYLSRYIYVSIRLCASPRAVGGLQPSVYGKSTQTMRCAGCH